MADRNQSSRIRNICPAQVIDTVNILHIEGSSGTCIEGRQNSTSVCIVILHQIVGHQNVFKVQSIIILVQVRDQQTAAAVGNIIGQQPAVCNNDILKA